MQSRVGHQATAGIDPAQDSGGSDRHNGTVVADHLQGSEARVEDGAGAAPPSFENWILRARRGQVVAMHVDGVELARAEWEANGDRI